MSRIVIVAVLAGICETACQYSTPRLFADESAAERHLSQHLNQFTAVAESWLSSGHSHLYWFGRSVLGPQLFTWNDHWVSPNWWAFQVMHWDGHEYVYRSAGTLDEAAVICGSTGQEILLWHSRLASLSIDTISRKNAIKDSQRFSYIEIGFFPARAPYGFRYAPRADSVAKRELKDLARQPHRRGLEMTELGGGWFYFEGFWAANDFPFQRER